MEEVSKWRLKTEGGIPYKVIDGSPYGTFDEVTGEITERLVIEADKLIEFRDEAFSKYTIEGSMWSWRRGREYPGTYYMTARMTFEPFPKSLPADPWECDATSSGGLPAGDDTYAKFMLVTVTYSSSQNKQWESDAIEFSSHASGEFLSIKSPVSLYWATRLWGGDLAFGPFGGAARDITTFNKVIPGIEWSVKYRPVPWAAMNRIVNQARLKLGVVNKDDSLPLFGATVQETIMFVGFSIRSVFTWREPTPFAWVEMKFLEKRINDNTISWSALPEANIGWNHFWNPAKGYFMRLVRRKYMSSFIGNEPTIIPFQFSPIYEIDTLAPLFNLRGI